MLAIASLFVVISLSLLVTRIATLLLVHTGLSRESARFQARSAFTGCGFTTSESERVVNHPVRRRVLMTLMLLGNAGIVTAVSSLMLTFVDQRDDGLGAGTKFLIVAVGIAVLWILGSSQWLDARLSHLIERLLARYTRLDVQDYASLLHLTDEYRVTELPSARTTGSRTSPCAALVCATRASTSWRSCARTATSRGRWCRTRTSAPATR
jgi:hypothetical protein